MTHPPRGIAPSSAAVAIVAVFSLVLVRAPLLIGDSVARRFVLLTPLLLCIAWALPRCRRGQISRGGAIIVGLYILSITIALFRGAKLGVYSQASQALTDGFTLAVVAVFGAVLFASAQSAAERSWRLVAVALAPAMYVAVNLALHLAGARSSLSLNPDTASIAANTPAQLLGFLGISANRIQFPLTNSINNFGAVAAAGFAAAVVLMLRTQRPNRKVGVIAAALCFAVILMSDSRGSLLISLAVILVFMLARRIRAAPGLAIVIPLSPVLVIGGLGFLSSSGIASIFSRTGDDLISGSGRLYIWQAALRVLQHPTLDHLFGYGAGGQVTSGASLHYAYLFVGSPNPTGFHTHNLVIQTVLDVGYAGLGLLIAAAVVSITRLERANRAVPASPVAALLAALYVLLLAGATEAIPTYYSVEALTFTALAFGASTSIGEARDAA